MIQSKVDTRFLGTIQDSFHGLPPLPEPVRIFFMFLGAGLVLLLFSYWIKKYGINSFLASLLRENVLSLLPGNKETDDSGKSATVSSSGRSSGGRNGPWKVSSDQDILERLVMSRMQMDVSAERAGQRTLAAVVNVAGTEGVDIVVTFKDVVSEDLLIPGTKVKCIFPEMSRDAKKVNAFVGLVKSFSKEKGAVITRRSAFGFIRRRVFARRKVADQRYIKVKIWRLECEDYDVGFILDNMDPEITIDNRKNVSPKINVPQVIDISKGGIALMASIREGGHLISRCDRVLLCMLIYLPQRKTFQPHLIHAEVRAARSAGGGMSRLSFQFLRSLDIPPRKRSSLFKGQAVMAMNLAQSEAKK